MVVVAVNNVVADDVDDVSESNFCVEVDVIGDVVVTSVDVGNLPGVVDEDGTVDDSEDADANDCSVTAAVDSEEVSDDEDVEGEAVVESVVGARVVCLGVDGLFVDPDVIAVVGFLVPDVGLFVVDEEVSMISEEIGI